MRNEAEKQNVENYVVSHVRGLLSGPLQLRMVVACAKENKESEQCAITRDLHLNVPPCVVLAKCFAQPMKDVHFQKVVSCQNPSISLVHCRVNPNAKEQYRNRHKNAAYDEW